MGRSKLLPLACVVVLSLAGQLPTAHAVLTYTVSGDVSPSTPSTWNSSTNGYIGNTSAGTLTVTGGNLLSNDGYIGYNSGVAGLVTVDGSGSTWTNNGDLRVGELGNGTLNVTNGGAVSDVAGRLGNSYGSTGAVAVVGTGSRWSNSGGLCVGNVGCGTLRVASGGAVTNTVGNIGVNYGSTGLVTVDGTGSTWTNSADLYIADFAGGGSLTITNGGAVSDRTCYIGFDAQTNIAGAVTVDGAGSTWTHSGLNVGYDNKCNGTVNVTNGGAVHTFNGAIGYNSGSTGTVTISGTGSTWTNTGANIYVGNSGRGTLNITAGGALINGNGGTYIGASTGSTGVATVDGTGSRWTEGDIISVGSSGSGTLNVTHGGAISSNRLMLSYIGRGMLNIASGGTVGDATGYIGVQAGSTGVARVDGTGSTWSNSGALYVGYSNNGGGTLSLTGGGAVTAAPISINSRSLLAIDVGRGSSLNAGSSGTITNNGTLRIFAGAGAPAGDPYSPISAGTWSGTGTCQALGGEWNASTHQFTASSVTTTTSGSATSIDLASIQRVLVTDSSTGWTLGESFLATTSSSTLTGSATPISDGPLTSLSSSLGSGETVAGGWTLAATSSYTSGDPVYLSFGVGAGQLPDDLEVWQYAGGSWTPYASSDLTYDGAYASFTATAMGVYAVAVPEPATFALLLGLALAGLARFSHAALSGLVGQRNVRDSSSA